MLFIKIAESLKKLPCVFNVRSAAANDATPQDRKVFLASLENALKLLANSTSYGVLNEFITDDHLKEVPTIVYHGGRSTKVKARLHKVGMDGETEISDYKAEKAGKFFAPFGTLIPAAGRLLLAIYSINRKSARRGTRAGSGPDACRRSSPS
jgi:hypothetical protein